MVKRGAHSSSYVTSEESKENRDLFLQLIRGNEQFLPMSVRRACDMVGISRVTVRSWREKYPDFALAYADAMEDGTDTIEDEAVRRAVEGVEEPVFQGGECVGYKQVYSDRLMECILAGRRPEKYSRNGSVNLQINNSQMEMPSDEQVARALALMLAEAKHQKKQIEHAK